LRGKVLNWRGKVLNSRCKVLNSRCKVLNSRCKVLNWRAKSTGRDAKIEEFVIGGISSNKDGHFRDRIDADAGQRPC